MSKPDVPYLIIDFENNATKLEIPDISKLFRLSGYEDYIKEKPHLFKIEEPKNNESKATLTVPYNYNSDFISHFIMTYDWKGEKLRIDNDIVESDDEDFTRFLKIAKDRLQCVVFDHTHWRDPKFFVARGGFNVELYWLTDLYSEKGLFFVQKKNTIIRHSFAWYVNKYIEDLTIKLTNYIDFSIASMKLFNFGLHDCDNYFIGIRENPRKLELACSKFGLTANQAFMAYSFERGHYGLELDYFFNIWRYLTFIMADYHDSEDYHDWNKYTGLEKLQPLLYDTPYRQSIDKNEKNE